MTTSEQRVDTVRSHPFMLIFFRLVLASVFVASAGVATHAAAATPVASTPTPATAQPTTAKPTAPATKAPPSSPTATPQRADPTSSPATTPTASAMPTTTPSPTASPIAAPLAATQTPAPPTPTAAVAAIATPTTITAPTAPATPAASAVPATTAVRLVAPTNVPATPPPPPGPTLDLSGFRLLDNPGVGGNTAIAHAALRHYGEFYRPDGVPWVGWCEMFAGNVLTEAGIAHPRYESAILDALDGPLYRGTAPAGSLVFFDQRSSPYGHVGVSLGDGTMLSALGGGVMRTSYQDWVSYLGWRPYGTTAPDDAPLNLHTYGATADDPSLSWTAQAPAIPDDPSIGWGASGLKAHSFHDTADTANLAMPLSHGDWDESPPYRSSRQVK